MDTFELKEFFGIVAQGFAEGDPLGTIKVNCPEKAIFDSGTLAHKEEDVVFTSEDIWGHRSTSSAKTSNTIPAIFFGGNSNTSIPDVVEGEQVRIRTYGNSGKYYWSPLRKDESLRKNEHIKITCASTPTRKKDLGDDNSYSIEVNSKKGKKRIRFRTAKADGEAYVYDFHIDIDNNIAYLNDDKGNELKLDSKGTVVHLKNADGSKVELNKKNIMIHAEDGVYINSKLVMLNGDQLITNFKTGIIGVVKMILKVASLSKA